MYYGAGEGSLVIASLNAGNSGALYVGGGGINSGFQRALSGQDTSAYQTDHQALAKSTPVGQTATQTYSSADPCASMTICNKPVALALAAVAAGRTDYTGVAFLDAFGDALCPKGNPNNRAMAYVAPPLGSAYTDDASFLSDVSLVGTHAIEALHAHNQWAEAQNAPVIEGLRMCMYSSVIYGREGVSQDSIALAIFAGIQTGLIQTGCKLAELQMPVGSEANNPYFAAVQNKLAS
ncbi:hypothetical protein [Tropicibacter oceani]|uniref:Uncharacterized protein n=1 Tax=Tropicibacter oceani TaxID=3058420 RepID=A0ABY8QHJ5_9RHOB|nr:hypothetical protein [Tropicibacter oceani]WGW04000.1 hypothetical protein QF118_00235 [Tropicibacter oceani]